MKIKYYPNTDTLYIELKPDTSVESEEIMDNVIVNYDKNNSVAGIEIEKVSSIDEIDIPISSIL